MSWIAKHMNVEQLGNITTSIGIIFLSKRVAYLRTLPLHNCAFFCLRTRRPDLANQIAESFWCRHSCSASHRPMHSSNKCYTCQINTIIWFIRLCPVYFYHSSHYLNSLVPWCAKKNMAAMAAVNFGWLGGAPNFFWQWQRGTFPAGGGSGIQGGIKCESAKLRKRQH